MFQMARVAVFMNRNVRIALQVTAPKALVNVVSIAMTALHSIRQEHVFKINTAQVSAKTVII